MLLLTLPQQLAAAAPAASFSRCPRPQFRTSPRASPTLFALPRRKYGRLHREPITTSFSDYDDDEEDEYEDDEVNLVEVEGEAWLEQRKPVGVGAWKTYGTAIEERLLREMDLGKEPTSAKRRDREPSPAKRRPAAANSLKETGGATDVSTADVHVRVWNLPRKKNIHRDLKLAFKGFPGLITINPAVSANKKTRDPICKGFAFLGMESVEAATRFVELYSRKSVAFGKVQKPISCCIIDGRSFVDFSNQASGSQAICQPGLNHHNVVSASSRKDKIARTSEILEYGPEKLS